MIFFHVFGSFRYRENKYLDLFGYFRIYLKHHFIHSDNSEYTSNRISLIRRLPNIETKCVQYIGIFRRPENNLFVYIGILRRFENGCFYAL